MNNYYPHDGGRGYMPQMHYESHGGNGVGTLGWVIFALELLMLAGIIVLLVRAYSTPQYAGASGRSSGRRRFGQRDPVAQARMRYANGEISRDEYLQITSDLGGAPAASAEAPTED
jgi:uncharacterized membrane protein